MFATLLLAMVVVVAVTAQQPKYDLDQNAQYYADGAYGNSGK
jgi:hypothetical protein